RGISDLAAIAATDTALVDMRHRIVAQRIVERLHRQGWAAGKPHAGMVAGADILVDAEFRLYNPLAALDRLVDHRLLAALPVQHAFRRSDDDLRSGLLRGQRLAQR